MTTLAPRAARSKAMEEPIPREAPVTMALGLISCVKEGGIGVVFIHFALEGAWLSWSHCF